MNINQQINHIPRVLVIDDDARARNTLIDILTEEHYSVLPAEDGETALKLIKANNLNVVLLDLVLPDINGLEVLKQIKKSKPTIPVIIISGYGTIKDAVAATKEGAYDFLEKSNFDKNKFILLIKRAAEKERIEKQVSILKEELLKKYQMVGISKPIRRVFELIEDTATKKVGILITGESGVGKELVARAIHNRSERKDKTFIKINCAAIPKELIESELFGYEKGAFTDAKLQKKGKLEMADAGSLFLDEIGDMSMSAQSKLLHFIQDGVFERLGSTETHIVDVRIIAATNKNLENEINELRFREDLFYRLNVVHIHIPPLRERLEDIPVLAEHFLDTVCEEYGVPQKSLTTDAVDFLKRQNWKGNIRELRNVIERSVILIRSIKINSNDLIKVMEIDDSKIKSDSKPLKDARDDFERDYILKMLNKYNWNLRRVSQILNIDRSHLYRKMKQLKITATNY
jgi:two-component system, NtrC family, nitrogen regulation response regulator NtrX